MRFLSLDLEMSQPSGKIIEIGACIGDLSTGIVDSTFTCLVYPDETVSPYITNLTGITNTALVDAGDLHNAYGRLLRWMAQNPPVATNPLTWGGRDTQDLLDQLGPSYGPLGECPWPFGHRWFDVKTVFQFYQISRGLIPQAGLSKALIKVGLKFEGRKHTAKDDAVNTFRMAHKLLGLMTHASI